MLHCYRGKKGFPGRRGQSYEKIVIAPTGPTGPSLTILNVDQPTGPTGPTGPMNNTNVIGSTGDPGLEGPPGSFGATGFQGMMGQKGYSQVLGPQGPFGASGPLGIKGNNGPTGPANTQGYPGSTGPAGGPGTALTPGPTGPQGPTGNPTSGPQGLTGAQGRTGDNGPNIIGYTSLPSLPITSNALVILPSSSSFYIKQESNIVTATLANVLQCTVLSTLPAGSVIEIYLPRPLDMPLPASIYTLFGHGTRTTSVSPFEILFLPLDISFSIGLNTFTYRFITNTIAEANTDTFSFQLGFYYSI